MKTKYPTQSNCLRCGKQYTKLSYKQQWCSELCAEAYKWEQAKPVSIKCVYKKASEYRHDIDYHGIPMA